MELTIEQVPVLVVIPWYDWVNVYFPETLDAENNIYCIRRIMVFFRYLSPQALSFKRVEVEGQDWETIQQQTQQDTTVYMLLHCSAEELTMSHIRRQFITPFKLTSLEDLYVLPGSMINCPVMVVPDMTGELVQSTEKFLAVVPTRMMDKYFLKYMKEEDERFEVDMNCEHRFDDGNTTDNDLTLEDTADTQDCNEFDDDSQQGELEEDDEDDNDANPDNEVEYLQEGYSSEDGDGFSDEEGDSIGYYDEEDDFYEKKQTHTTEWKMYLTKMVLNML
jgi:hypothetical protein